SKVDQAFDLITGMTVLEINDLKKKFETDLGITAAAPMMMAGMMPGMGRGVGGQPEFAALLPTAGEKKIQVIKVVRAIPGLGLKEAKDLVDNAPKPIKEKVPRPEAPAIKSRVERGGGAAA